MASDPCSEIEFDAPIVIDLGKKKRKDIRKLRKGSGRLRNRVATCIQELKANGKIAPTAQPIVIVVKEKKKKRTGLLSM